MAIRDIGAGEVILTDQPIIQSPYTRSKAQCLQCSKKIQGPKPYLCKGCGFPMCDKTCASGDLHNIECSVLAQADFEAEIEDFSSIDDHYACIMPIRLCC